MPAGIEPGRLTDEVLRREMEQLHKTRHEAVVNGSADALTAHTQRMLALEEEFVKRFPSESAPDPMRTRAGSRKAAGQAEEQTPSVEAEPDHSQGAIVAAHPQNEDTEDHT